jgi:hypothetical protein
MACDPAQVPPCMAAEPAASHVEESLRMLVSVGPDPRAWHAEAALFKP